MERFTKEKKVKVYSVKNESNNKLYTLIEVYYSIVIKNLLHL